MPDIWEKLAEIKTFIEECLEANPGLIDEWAKFEELSDIHIAENDETHELEFWVYPVANGQTKTNDIYFQLVF